MKTVKSALAAALLPLTLIVCGCDKIPKFEGSGKGAAANAAVDHEEDSVVDDEDHFHDEPEYFSLDINPGAYDYITDPRDGKRYRTIKIGGLTWMAENLNHASGTSFCYGEDDTNCDRFGRLYCWTEDFCPAGWRLPSINDWDNLFLAVGGSFDVETRRWNTAGAKLKSKTGWKNDGGGTDEFGFTALPGGFREQGHNYTNERFRFAGSGGYWWTSEHHYRAMGWNMNHVNENVLYYCFSVRCVTGDAGAALPASGKGRPAPSAPSAPEINTALPVGTPDAGWYSSGTANFTISTACQLAGLAELVNGGNNFAGVTIRLDADIDLSAYGRGSAFNGGKGWIPIRMFQGTFDGNGKKVHGLYINDPNLDNAGLFGYINSYSDHKVTVRNLGVVDVNITGRSHVGGVIGTNYGEVINCYSTGVVNGLNSVGGITGGGFASNSYSTAAVTGNQYVGGVIGQGSANMCYFTGTVKGDTDVGGVVGLGSANNCYSTGTVSGRAGRVGGVVGRINGGKVANCYSTGAVSGREGTGGVAGSIVGGSLENSVALNPSVTGTCPMGPRRVVGYAHHSHTAMSTLLNNAAFIDLKNTGGHTDRTHAKGLRTRDGKDITAEELSTDPTLGGRFREIDDDGKPTGWTIDPGKLPGLGGKTVDMPKHLR